MKTYKSQDVQKVAEQILRELILATEQISIVQDETRPRHVGGARLKLVPRIEERRNGIFGFINVDLVQEKLAWMLRQKLVTVTPLGFVQNVTGIPISIEILNLKQWKERETVQ